MVTDCLFLEDYMKKPFFAVLFAACVVLPLAAQEVTDTGALTMSEISLLRVNNYYAYFGSNQKDISRSYVDLAPDADYERFAVLDGDTTDVDTPGIPPVAWTAG
jgi:hypothetical protein